MEVVSGHKNWIVSGFFYEDLVSRKKGVRELDSEYKSERYSLIAAVNYNPLLLPACPDYQLPIAVLSKRFHKLSK